MPETYVLPLFAIVVALYASVGHGGASGYLALFALLGPHAGSRLLPVRGVRMLLASVLVLASGKLIVTVMW